MPKKSEKIDGGQWTFEFCRPIVTDRLYQLLFTTSLFYLTLPDQILMPPQIFITCPRTTYGDKWHVKS